MPTSSASAKREENGCVQNRVPESRYSKLPTRPDRGRARWARRDRVCAGPGATDAPTARGPRRRAEGRPASPSGRRRRADRRRDGPRSRSLWRLVTSSRAGPSGETPRTRPRRWRRSGGTPPKGSGPRPTPAGGSSSRTRSRRIDPHGAPGEQGPAGGGGARRRGQGATGVPAAWLSELDGQASRTDQRFREQRPRSRPSAVMLIRGPPAHRVEHAPLAGRRHETRRDPTALAVHSGLCYRTRGEVGLCHGRACRPRPVRRGRSRVRQPRPRAWP